ncbi:MAG: DUF2846 domain-containing protein [Candidatus Brocadiaceae bacterium]
MKTMHKFIIMLFITTLCGCATVQMASPQLDQEAKSFTASPEKSNIYIVRGMGAGLAVIFQIALDGKIIGSIAPNTYHLLAVTPGQHMISAFSMENSAQVSINAEAGKNYYIKVSTHMGWTVARVGIEIISEEEGKGAVLGAKRAESISY